MTKPGRKEEAHDSSPHLVIIQSSIIPPSGFNNTLNVDLRASLSPFGTGKVDNEAGSILCKNLRAPGPVYLYVENRLVREERGRKERGRT